MDFLPICVWRPTWLPMKWNCSVHFPSNALAHTLRILDQSRYFWKILCLKFHTLWKFPTTGELFIINIFAKLRILSRCLLVPDHLSKTAIQFPKVMDIYLWCFLCLYHSDISPILRLQMNIEGGEVCTRSCKVTHPSAWNKSFPECHGHCITLCSMSGWWEEWKLR